MHNQWLVGRYCKGLSPPRKRQFEMKVLAESIFKGTINRFRPIVSFIDDSFFMVYFQTTKRFTP